MRPVFLYPLLFLLSACSGPVNNPYPAAERGQQILYSAFSERPKHLDPARSYASNETVFLGQVYEPPLQYHYLKRPYELIPLTALAVPKPLYFDAAGKALAPDTPAAGIAESVYEIHLRPGIRYQPHAALAASRELTADDYVYQIKRLAHPALHSPIYGLMADYIVGLRDLGSELDMAAKRQKGWLDLRRFPLAGAVAVDRYTYRIRIKGKYPQFVYWLAMPFFAPVPWEIDAWYGRPGMAENNQTLDVWPVGTGPYMMTVHQPNRQIRLVRNLNFRGEPYPADGEPGDRAAGLLADAGKTMPFIDQAVYSMESETIPYWNKFLQGWYDASGISSDSFDQAVRTGTGGETELTPEMLEKGIALKTSVAATSFYTGFNMLDPVVGGLDEKHRKLRQALAIALDVEEYIAIFANGRGIPAQGPLPPGLFGYRDGKAGINPVVYDWVDGKPKRKAVAEAKRLLAEAGWPGGRDAVTGKPLVLNFDTAARGPDDKARLDWLRKQFKKLDIELVIRGTDYNRFQDKMREGTEQIFEWGWNADYPDPENFLFLLYGPNRKVGSGGENVANYVNPEFDRLFVQMKDMANGPGRQEVIDRMVTMLRADSPWLFGFHPKDYVLHHAWLQNVKPNLMANNGLKYRRIDPVARETARAAWNRPHWAGPLLAVLVLILVLVPAWRAYRRSQEATVFNEGRAR
ncbi:MAG: ABC transporter substrate-binding protein [Gallionellaceae bacterium]|nr:ABC transporter substrate-binding protein [Gallionellaceae bacterium]